MWAKSSRTKVGLLLAQDNELVGSPGCRHQRRHHEHGNRAGRDHALPTLDAGTLLLGGVGLMHRFDPRDFDKGRLAFEHLIERYPRFRRPSAYLAEWHVLKVAQGWFASLDKEAASALDRINRARSTSIRRTRWPYGQRDGARQPAAQTRERQAELRPRAAEESQRRSCMAASRYAVGFQGPRARSHGGDAARGSAPRRWIRGGTTTNRCARRQHCPREITNAHSSWRGARCKRNRIMFRRCASSPLRRPSLDEWKRRAMPSRNCANSIHRSPSADTWRAHPPGISRLAQSGPKGCEERIYRRNSRRERAEIPVSARAGFSGAHLRESARGSP